MKTMSRLLIVLAGLMGAAGVALAAAAAHGADAARLLPASTMLLFHACAVLGAIALADRSTIHGRLGLIATIGFVVATALFSGDLTMRHFTGDRLFPMAAPTGGALLIGSWLVLALAAVWPGRR